MPSPDKPEQDAKTQATDTQSIETTPPEQIHSEMLKKAILKLKSQTLPHFEGGLENNVTERLPSAGYGYDSDESEDITLTLDKTLTAKDLAELRDVANQANVGTSDTSIALTTDKSNALSQASAKAMTAREQTPWTLQQFFDGEIDLDIELSKRFPSMPLLSTIKFRNLGSNSGRKVATLDTADGAASLIVDADTKTKVVQLSFTYGSMMSLRYSLNQLSDMDRTRWLELMKRDNGGLAFLWGPSRWQDDYLICIARKYATNIYAFSPSSFESAVRLTPTVTKQLIDWLDEVWQAVIDESDDDSPLLTW